MYKFRGKLNCNYSNTIKNDQVNGKLVHYFNVRWLKHLEHDGVADHLKGNRAGAK